MHFLVHELVAIFSISREDRTSRSAREGVWGTFVHFLVHVLGRGEGSRISQMYNKCASKILKNDVL